VPVSPSKAARRHQQAAITAGLADHDASVVMTIMERLTAVEVPRGGGGDAAARATLGPRAKWTAKNNIVNDARQRGTRD
jgi:hypothetical protein